jgi:uncharacterized protein (TIRG00374 family)
VAQERRPGPEGRAPSPSGRHHAEHPHGHSLYEAEEFLDAPPEERIPAQEVSLARRFGSLRTIGSLLFALVLVFLLFRYVLGVDLGETWRRITQADVGLLVVAFIAYYLTFPLRGLRWRLLLARGGCHVPFVQATEILYLSWFVNCVVPAKLGDLYRAYLLRENYGASVSRTVGSIFIERIADIVVIFGLALAAGYWSFRGRERPEVDALFLAGFVFAGLLVAVVVGLRFWGRAVASRLPARLEEFYERFHQGSVGVLEPRTTAVVVVLTGLIWMAEAFRFFFVVRALGLPDVGLGISASVFAALAASLLTAIPLTPAGIGFVEAGIVGVLALYGVDAQSATAVALTDRAISILSVLVLGGLLYVFSGMVRRAHGVGAAPADSTSG